MRTAKAPIRLGECPGLSESSLGAHVILLVLSCGDSYANYSQYYTFVQIGYDFTNINVIRSMSSMLLLFFGNNFY